MSETEMRPLPVLTRRAVLVGGGAVVFAACTSGGQTADTTQAPTTTAAPSTGDGTATSAPAATATSGPDGQGGDADIEAFTPNDFDPLATCVLVPETTTGPFPLDQQLVRRDITEGYPGHPLRLGLRVVDTSCDPIAGAAVEIWHTDATGDYSAFADNGGGKDEGPGTTFLRGTQMAGDDGIVEFATVYPGWYPGRAVHIHLRVRIDERTALTSQLYFDDDYTEGVYREEPYREFGLPDTTNVQDRIAGDVANDGSLLALAAGSTTVGPGTIGLVNIGLA